MYKVQPSVQQKNRSILLNIKCASVSVLLLLHYGRLYWHCISWEKVGAVVPGLGCWDLRPGYYQCYCTPVAASAGRCNLHSATRGDLLVHRTRTYEPCSFAVFRPCVWNDLPLTLCASPLTLRQVQSTLKTMLLCFTGGGVEFAIFLLLFACALQQCSVTALPVISYIILWFAFAVTVLYGK